MHLHEISATVTENPSAVPAEDTHVYDYIPTPIPASDSSPTTAVYDDLKEPAAAEQNEVELTPCVAYSSSTQKKVPNNN